MVTEGNITPSIREDENVIGISKHYLKKVIKDCYRAKEKGTLEDEHIIGKIRYIKLISDKSFDRLIKALNSNDNGKEIIHTINFALRNLGN